MAHRKTTTATTRLSWAALATSAGLCLSLCAALPASAAPTDAAGPAASASPIATIVNAGFESGLDGWSVSGVTAAAKTESGGYDSANRLTHWLPEAGSVTTSQTVTGLSEGWWTFTAAVKSGGVPGSSRLVASDCGQDSSTVIPSTTVDDAWLHLSVSAYVSHGTCTIGLATNGAAGSWASIDDATIARGTVDRAIRGADLSSLPKNEANGAKYFDATGHPVDAVTEFASAGANLVRLKVFVNPADGFNDQAHVVAMAKRIKAAGMGLLVDFHYSDTWADPGKQTMPAAWVGLTVPQVAQKVYDHTHSVLTALARAGITADAVQIGNEINPGMLWPLGQTWDVIPGDGVDGAQWDSLASFLTAGAKAVKDVNRGTKVILHLTNINNGIDSLTWWFDEVTARNVPFDVIGLSYYSYWHGSFADLQNAITTLSSRYDKDVLVVETAYPFTLADNTSVPWENTIDQPSELVADYPATPEGQAANFRAIQDVVASAPGGRGLGAVYWEPAWTAVAGNGWDPADPTSGNAWENQAMFDFTGRALPALADYAPDATAAPLPVATPGAIDFGTVKNGTKSAAKDVVITNTGPVTLTASFKVTATSGITINKAPARPVTIAPGATATVATATIRPSRTGAVSGSIAVDIRPASHEKQPVVDARTLGFTGTLTIPVSAVSVAASHGHHQNPPKHQTTPAMRWIWFHGAPYRR